MKTIIQLPIALITLLPSLHSAPNPVVVADFDKALIMKESTPDSVSHADVISRIQELEREVYFLDQQVVSISKQLFESYGLYIIRPGDTLGKIAMNHGIEMAKLLDLNHDLNPEKLEVGQIIRVRK